MAIHDVKVERAALDARARAILDECPDVFRLIARGAAIDREHEAIVYLRTALDPAPAVTTARSFLGFVSAAGRWLRENGVGPDDTVSILAPNCTAVSVAYWSAMSFATVHPLNLLFSREAIAAQLPRPGRKSCSPRRRARPADCSRRSRASLKPSRRSSGS